MKTSCFNFRGHFGLQLFRGGVLLTSIVALGFSSALVQAEPPWSSPVTLSSPAINAHSPQVAISDTGAMAATWVRQEGSLYQVQASVTSNGIWSSAVTLSQTDQNAFESSVAIDRNGVATAVWTIGNMIQASTYRPFKRGGWSAPVVLSDMSISALAPRVVVDASGNATAMWVRYNMEGVPGVETAYCPAGGHWSGPLLVAPGAPRDLMLVMNVNGDAAAIWDIGAFTSNTGIYVSNRPAGTPWGLLPAWSAPYNLVPLAYRQGGGKIAIASNGDITACWRSNTDIRVADKPAGGNWSGARTVYSSHSLAAYPTLAVTPSGDAMAAWITAVFTGGSYNYQIGNAVRPVGGDWSAPALLTGSDEYDTEMHAGTNKAGACVLTWVDVNSSSLKTSTWTVEKGWYDTAIIAAGSDTSLAVGSDTAVAIWIGGWYQAQVSTAPIH